MGYVYRGTGEDILTPDIKMPKFEKRKYTPPTPDRVKKDTVHREDCGTERGYRMHKHRNEITCQPCRDAHNERNKQRPSYTYGKKD